MDITEYQRISTRTINKTLFYEELLSNMAMGIAGESGEVIDLLKKYLYQKHDLDRKKIEEELGDVMFYIVNLATALNLSMEIILEKNVEKLKKRYPKGFNSKDSIERIDTHE